MQITWYDDSEKKNSLFGDVQLYFGTLIVTKGPKLYLCELIWLSFLTKTKVELEWSLPREVPTQQSNQFEHDFVFWGCRFVKLIIIMDVCCAQLNLGDAAVRNMFMKATLDGLNRSVIYIQWRTWWSTDYEVDQHWLSSIEQIMIKMIKLSWSDWTFIKKSNIFSM